jgi:hypothetical protein
MTNEPTLFPTDPPPPPDHECPMCGGTGRVDDETFRRLIEDRPGAVGRKHPSTSREAAYEPNNVVRFGTERYKALTALRDLGPSNARRVAKAYGGIPNQTATRLGELRIDGFAARCRDDDGGYLVEETTTGNEGIVHTITAAGLAALRAVKR